MKSSFRKYAASFTLVSVFFLSLNCGPICEADSAEIPATSESSPCHQDQNSENNPGCDWDSGSLSLEGTKVRSFKFAPDSVFVSYQANKSENLSNNRFAFFIEILCFWNPPPSSFIYLSSVRLLI